MRQPSVGQVLLKCCCCCIMTTETTECRMGSVSGIVGGVEATLVQSERGGGGCSNYMCSVRWICGACNWSCQHALVQPQQNATQLSSPSLAPQPSATSDSQCRFNFVASVYSVEKRRATSVGYQYQHASILVYRSYSRVHSILFLLLLPFKEQTCSDITQLTTASLVYPDLPFLLTCR